jgi:hypothetical protein
MQLISDKLLGLRIKTIHTHIQLIHDRHRMDQNCHIFITGAIPSQQRYTLCRTDTYDNHRTSYLLYINPHNYNMLHNVPLLKTQTYKDTQKYIQSITILQQAQSELDTKTQ